ncbi:MAG: biotin--[acetyl-CoA-carboxylase] ligase [Castellaniella sp.]|uniref:biotin--[acetyl-CoA-carboxylase] ligase n=1 Tax=Castellaniella sp. TaxID=1955812 RepID=UPI002A36D18E|nr:biotin--[acetyl-CoA-carboxylase] ligase [Castellaniella sp.]MDY0310053.1 biotin--[acetyl-CoA-carboxylase] ligase [Castellaniella sp.]
MTGSSHESASALPHPAAMASALREALPQFRQVDWLEQTGSTNADLLARARHADGPPDRPWLLGTHLQSQGRGRAGRTWQNRIGANLMFSCAFDVFLPARQLPALAPLIGMVTCQALRTRLAPRCRPRLTMKWPNDLLWDQAKLAGILIESTRSGTAQAADHHLIIIGMGLNLEDARALSQSLDRRIADWAEIVTDDPTAAHFTATDLAACAARSWYDALNHATAHGFADLPARYAEVDGLVGRMLDVLDDGHLRHTGAAVGIDTDGRLLLRNVDGTQAISIGEISVRLQR